MAGIQWKDGKATVQFTGPDGRRRTIRLGKVSERNAGRFAEKLEQVNTAAKLGTSLDDDLSAWVAKLGDDVAEKLTVYGLIVRREVVPLGKLIDDFIDQRADVKPQTKVILRHTRANLVELFGFDKPLRLLTPGDADDFRSYLLRSKAEGGAGLSENTARRRGRMAKQFLRVAVRKGMIRENPFADLGGMVRGNKARSYFVTIDETSKVIEACPDAEWRLIVALSRFGGLRTPSEHNRLRWSDVDWARGKFLVHSPKTEHHAGGESRWVPIFPELRPYLEAAFEAAEPGAEYVIVRNRNRANLRTRFEKIIKRAGLKPWPKLFQNLRSTRQTELAAQYPLHVVCAWIGNKEAVAAEHYLQVTDADFERASAENRSRAALALHTGADSARLDPTNRTGRPNEIASNCEESSPVVNHDFASIRPEGFEPPTLGSEDRCAIQLRHGRVSPNLPGVVRLTVSYVKMV